MAAAVAARLAAMEQPAQQARTATAVAVAARITAARLAAAWLAARRSCWGAAAWLASRSTASSWGAAAWFAAARLAARRSAAAVAVEQAGLGVGGERKQPNGSHQTEEQGLHVYKLLWRDRKRFDGTRDSPLEELSARNCVALGDFAEFLVLAICPVVRPARSCLSARKLLPCCAACAACSDVEVDRFASRPSLMAGLSSIHLSWNGMGMLKRLHRSPIGESCQSNWTNSRSLATDCGSPWLSSVASNSSAVLGGLRSPSR